MLKYVGYRLATLLGLMVVMSGLTFTAIRLVPADPAALAAGPGAQRAQIEELRRQLGLDQPLWIQYEQYVLGLVHLDLGRSLITHQPIAGDLARYLSATLELTFAATVLFIVLGVGAGIVSATTRSRSAAWGLEGVALLGIAVPTYWLALAMQMVFYGRLGWLPSGGRLSAAAVPPAVVTGSYLVDSLLALNLPLFWDAVKHLVLPATAVALSRLSILARLMKAGIVDVQQRVFITTAYAKGLDGGRVLRRHVLKNALNPVVSALGLNIGYALAGQLIVEVIFSWPGVGRYAVDSIQAFDYPAVTAVALLMLAVFGLLNLLVDLCYPLLDPRITFQ